jgi:phosphate transport system permease protein
MTTLREGPGRSGAQIPGAAAPQAPEPSGPGADRPRRVGTATTDDYLALWGSIAGSAALVWVVYGRVLPLSGPLGFIVCWYATFLALYWAVSAMAHPRPVVRDRLAAAVVRGGALVVIGAVASAIVYTFSQGRHAIIHLNFYTHDMAGVEPTAPLTQGGIVHAIVGTLIEIGIAIVVSLPLGVGTAVFISEVGGRFARGVRTIVEAMTALPDILAGLFIYFVLIVKLGVPKSGFAAAMALSVMMLPIIARSAEVVLRIVPGGLREASLALGASRWRTVWQVVLPTARPGLATALILGVARGIGETAPVLLTSGASTFLNWNPLQNPMNSLPLFIWAAFQTGEQQNYSRYWGAASVLLALVLALFVIVRLLARSRPGRS